MKRIGEVFNMNSGVDVVIVAGGSSRNKCIVRFLDDSGYETETDMSTLRKGNMRSPLFRGVCGLGYIGVGRHKTHIDTKQTRSHRAWMSMMCRCYAKSTLEIQKSYREVEVCEEWHNFQNFSEWFEANYVEGWHLDKDLFSTNIKIYSPSTCCYIPNWLNSFIATKRPQNTTGSTGVSIEKNTMKFLAYANFNGKRKTIGRYKTLSQAIDAYNRTRMEYKKLAAIRYKEEAISKHISGSSIERVVLAILNSE